MVGRLIVFGTVLVALAGAAPARAAVACPGGGPSQTITVVNQAGVRPATLARVERAVSAQSLQVHAAWGTPCAQFAPGGWKLYLKIGGSEPRGEHDYYGQPYALVWTGGGSVESWSRDVSHEVIEMLEDPTLDVRYLHDGSTWQREIAAPVEGLGYRFDAAPAINAGPWDQMRALAAPWAMFGPRTLLSANQ